MTSAQFCVLSSDSFPYLAYPVYISSLSYLIEFTLSNLSVFLSTYLTLFLMGGFFRSAINLAGFSTVESLLELLYRNVSGNIAILNGS